MRGREVREIVKSGTLSAARGLPQHAPSLRSGEHGLAIALPDSASTVLTAWPPDRSYARSLAPSAAAVLAAVAEVDHEADQPARRAAGARCRRQRGHEAEAGQHAEDRAPAAPAASGTAGSRSGSRLPQDQHADAHEHERQQRADVDQLAEDPDREAVPAMIATTMPMKIVERYGVRNPGAPCRAQGADAARRATSSRRRGAGPGA